MYVIPEQLSPASQSFNSLLLFRELWLVVLRDLHSFDDFIGGIFPHAQHDRRVPNMSHKHVVPSDDNHTGCSARGAGKTC